MGMGRGGRVAACVCVCVFVCVCACMHACVRVCVWRGRGGARLLSGTSRMLANAAAFRKLGEGGCGGGDQMACHSD